LLLYYISSLTKKNAFDSICEKNNIYVQHFDVANIYNLKEFVLRNNTLINANYFVIDLTDADFTPDNIIDGAEIYKKLYNSRLVFISPSSKYVDLFAKLSDKGINNLISVSDGTDLLKEFEICISQNGKSYLDVANIRNNSNIETAKRIARPTIKIKDGVSIKIGIAGADIRTGCTTQAFAITQYMKWLGFESCYVDAVGKHYLSIIDEHESNLIDKISYFIFKGCNISSKIPDGNSINASIIDFGVLSNDNIANFSKCDMQIVLSGSKLWEMSSIANILTEYDCIKNSFFVFSFASDDDKEMVKKLFATVCTPYFAPYQPDVFRLDNTSFYNTMLLSTIKQIAEE